MAHRERFILRRFARGFFRRTALCWLAAVAIALPLLRPAAALGDAGDEVDVFSLTPARADDASLRHRLLPELTELSDEGNAADLYRDAFEAVDSLRENQPADANWRDWMDMPLDALPKEKIRAMLGEAAWLKLIDKAARCRRCAWKFEPGKRDTMAWGASRHVSSVLAIRARLAIAEQRYEDALRDIATGFAMARHVHEIETLDDVLISQSLLGAFFEQLETLAAQPDAPNLFWAHQRIPRLLPPLDAALERERLLFERHWPKLQQKEGVIELPTEQWLRMGMAATFNSSLGGFMPDMWNDPEFADFRQTTRQVTLAKVMWTYPVAKQHFLDAGVAPQKLAAMSPTDVVMTYAFRRYQLHRDRLHAWLSLPYHKFAPHRERAERPHRDASSEYDGFPFVRILLARASSLEYRARLQRSRRVLVIAEALRDHLARHGELPASIDDIELPLPDDPVTGKPFRLEKREDGVLLTSDTLEGVEDDRPVRVLFNVVEAAEEKDK